ncbi:MAG: ABC transporter ATP-binding protein [Candidatus Bathyarchaeia archaeon]
MKFLEVQDIYSGYGDMEVLHGVSISVADDEIVTIIGPNGSGKSTLLKTIMGYLIPYKGKITLHEEDVTKLRPDEKVRKGVGYVSQLNNVFPSLTMEENLEMGGYIESGAKVRGKIGEAYDLFPILKEKRRQRAGTMSGGQRQMLAMARALMTDPRLLLLDEPSAGLAPKVALEVFKKIEEIHRMGTAIVIVEQDAYHSLGISDRGYVLAMGQNEFEDDADKILSNEKIREAYLGG